MLQSNNENNLDPQIDQLMECKPLNENEVKILSEKVNIQKKVMY